MIHFEFPFTFDNAEYTAGCQVMPPNPEKQYHVFLRAPNLKQAHGPTVIFIMHEPWQFNFPSDTAFEHPQGPILINSLYEGLIASLRTHPQYL